MAGIVTCGRRPLFRNARPPEAVTADRLDRREALAMVKRRAVDGGHREYGATHSFRATGITNTYRTAAPWKKGRPSPPTSRHARPSS